VHPLFLEPLLSPPPLLSSPANHKLTRFQACFLFPPLGLVSKGDSPPPHTFFIFFMKLQWKTILDDSPSPLGCSRLPMPVFRNYGALEPDALPGTFRSPFLMIGDGLLGKRCAYPLPIAFLRFPPEDFLGV